MGIEETYKKFRRALMWIALVMVVLLVILSVCGAFLGSYRAKTFFNSPVLSAYWLALTALLTAAIIVFRPIRLSGLFLMHSGCILVLVGALWGSGTGLKVGNRLFGTDKIQTGQMVIFEGDAENRIRLEGSDRFGRLTAGQTKELPFHIKLKDFRIEFYKPESVRDCISDVQVVKNGNVVAEKSIEVNHPLHFGGYHFYQNSYDAEGHKYTVLSVVSDTGLNFVYAGYLALGIGVFWHFWVRHIFTKQNSNGN
jgi:cytochrome c biogenesis protein ResB